MRKGLFILVCVCIIAVFNGCMADQDPAGGLNTEEQSNKSVDEHQSETKSMDSSKTPPVIDDLDASEGKAKADTELENILAQSDEETLTIGMMSRRSGKLDDGQGTVNIMYSIEAE